MKRRRRLLNLTVCKSMLASGIRFPKNFEDAESWLSDSSITVGSDYFK
jgi:hypothetical protein